MSCKSANTIAPSQTISSPPKFYRRRLVYEVDPLICPNCGGTMKIVSIIEQREVVRRILGHCKLWKEPPEKPPKHTDPQEMPEVEEGVDFIPDYTVFEDTTYED